MTWTNSSCNMSARNSTDTRLKRPNNFQKKRNDRKTPSPKTIIHPLQYTPRLGNQREGDKNRVDENNNGSPFKEDAYHNQQANIAYAGAKFSEPPSPALLPKPPSHWMSNNFITVPTRCDAVSDQLKMLLKMEVVTY